MKRMKLVLLVLRQQKALVSDEEVESLLPAAAYATPKIMFLIFAQDGSHYMVYTPSDPLLFVAAKAKAKK
ncbi:hypothetical protein V5N11_020435 [Cardamine amara subsp. amara]|uniref:Uncharacterized protein n=1 Tax=Cardamine amara subsp. amara TaxID=228776 RepID=A0ABD1AYU7_CARAN